MSCSGPRVAVFGAGAFGGWTALELQRRGAAVTLIDAWGPGNARASSGGHTRVLRATYGSHAIYTRMAVRALRLWREFDARSGADALFHPAGALWLLSEQTRFGEAATATLRSEGVALEEIGVTAAAHRYPQIAFDGIRRVLFEPDAGYLLACRACEQVRDRLVAQGGSYRQAAAVAPVEITSRGVRLQDDSLVSADCYVFACGPWLGALFPDVVGRRIVATRQEAFYFGLPADAARYTPPALPVWLECGERFVYGIPAADGRGFKIADDTPGAEMDPSSDGRAMSPDGLAAARAFLSRRFPALRDAPLVSSEVCQYEATPDSHFIIDRHPVDPRVVIAGGGSGHGFKMGPVIGEMAAALALGESDPEPQFALTRLDTEPADGWQSKWS